MKEQKGFSSFLGEEKKSKPKRKTSSTSKKKKERKKSGGKDDDRYVSLMDEYKRSRGRDSKMADKIHEKAIDLRNNGDVSQDAVTAGHYV